MDFIPYGRQWIDESDMESVQRVLHSDFLTQGPEVSRFEEAVCRLTGARYCVAVSSGTAALHLAVASLELEEGEEGITSPITFVASANAMQYSRVVPRFADIDPRTYNLDPVALEGAVTPRTRLLLPVHFAGQPADMPAFRKIADTRGCRIIEDASHAIGSQYADGMPVGSCRYSDLTVFSFHPVKTITTGEGGAVTTNDPILYERVSRLRTHGIVKDTARLDETPGPWYYEMQALGFNYRLTDLQAALGTSQLAKLETFRKRRREIVEQYNRAFEDEDRLEVPFEDPRVTSCFHLYVLQLDFEAIGMTRREVMEFLKGRGIGTQVHYIPVHFQPYYRQRFGYGPGDFPIAEAYYGSALSVPLYPAMTGTDVKRVIDGIHAVVRRGKLR
ncbi:MAG: UDP-4-amino-4,6-dideoxy-N-acetyl-beta-L-altrosamine transaminase [Spirochaetales bacterium]|nr:UDP-4-amino-4,6-dideoxy-N-acetyl-beta-L-altrosamine transaminase [Spirochaetales bacterium]